jgi:hypothetical protein
MILEYLGIADIITQSIDGTMAAHVHHLKKRCVPFSRRNRCWCVPSGVELVEDRGDAEKIHDEAQFHGKLEILVSFAKFKFQLDDSIPNILHGDRLWDLSRKIEMHFFGT